ncbi:hypothetical protein D3C72_1833630 [compost metagenome]
MHIERGAGGLRVLGDQFKVGERGQQRHREGHQEGQPGRPANLGGHLSGQRIHAGAQDVAHNEEQQQLGAHDPFELRVVLRVFRGHRLFPLLRFGEVAPGQREVLEKV